MKIEEAHKIVQQEIFARLPEVGLMEDLTQEFESCFAVYYQSLDYVKSRDSQHMLVGHGAVLVDKNSGKLFETGSAYPTEHYVKVFDSCGHPYGEPTKLVKIESWNEGANAVKAIKYLRDKTLCGLAQSKNVIDSVLNGEKMTVEFANVEDATDAINKLNEIEFNAKQLWAIPDESKSI